MLFAVDWLALLTVYAAFWKVVTAQFVGAASLAISAVQDPFDSGDD